jgi:pimeloyl-ACP methyl ester carboxylesterase
MPQREAGARGYGAYRLNVEDLKGLLLEPGTPRVVLVGRSIETPTLVVNGPKTQWYFAEVGRAVADSLPYARHTVVSGASHAVPSHNLSQFNAA